MLFAAVHAEAREVWKGGERLACSVWEGREGNVQQPEVGTMKVGERKGAYLGFLEVLNPAVHAALKEVHLRQNHLIDETLQFRKEHNCCVVSCLYRIAFISFAIAEKQTRTRNKTGSWAGRGGGR